MANRSKGPLVVLVLSSKTYDDCAHVHRTLDEINEKKGISIVAHLGRGAGAFASAWSRIARPTPVSEFISRAATTKLAVKAVLASHVDLVVVFDRKTFAAVRKMASKRGIAVLNRSAASEE